MGWAAMLFVLAVCLREKGGSEDSWERFQMRLYLRALAVARALAVTGSSCFTERLGGSVVLFEVSSEM